MKNSIKNIKIGIIILVSSFGMFGVITYAMSHGFLMDFGYLIHYPPRNSNMWDYPGSMKSQFENEIIPWGIFGYLRIGFLVIGISGMIYVIINGVILLKRKK